MAEEAALLAFVASTHTNEYRLFGLDSAREYSNRDGRFVIAAYKHEMH